MPKIAIDIVLLPPEEIMNLAIGFNVKFPKDPIELNQVNCLPHISLCMGVVNALELPKINEILSEIVRDFTKLQLSICKINSKHCCFEIVNTKILQKLHTEVMTRLSPHLSYDATIDMCFSPPKVVEKTLGWINGFKENTSFDNFYPHITLGISQIEERTMTIDFIASKLAICHLGNYCTCRKVISTWTLK